MRLLTGLDHLVVQDIFLTKTAELAHVVLPASSSWCESEGTVTNSERRVQRVRKALEPPGNARDDRWIISEIAKRMGYDWGHPTAEEVWNEVRSLAPIFVGHELRAARTARAVSTGPATTRTIPASCSCTAGSVEGPGRGHARAVLRGRARSAGGAARRASIRSCSPPGAAWIRTTRACRPAATRRRSGGARASTSRRRTPSACGFGTAIWCG